MGLADFSRVHIQATGDETLYGNNARKYGRDGEGPRECLMWIAVEHRDKKALEIFAREIAPAGTGISHSIQTMFSMQLLADYFRSLSLLQEWLRDWQLSSEDAQEFLQC